MWIMYWFGETRKKTSKNWKPFMKKLYCVEVAGMNILLSRSIMR